MTYPLHRPLSRGKIPLQHLVDADHGDAAGGEPYVAFRRNANGNWGLFGRLYHHFKAHEEEFLTHYHRWSNVESTVSAIKAKFRDDVRARTEMGMRNEALCHNLCCVIGAIYELGIGPRFEGLVA